jgi:hypothetical protein
MLCLLVGCSAPASVPPAVDTTRTSAPPAAPTIPASIPPTVAPTSPPASTPTTAPTGEARTDGLSDEEAATLGSLEQVDDYPLYTMHYHGPYEQRMTAIDGVWRLASANPPHPGPTASSPAWACSLFAALGDPEEMLYGRNFDWEYSPAVLLFTDPPGGYASVSMVDIAYLGFGGASAGRLADLPLVERRALLDAPRMPFDGMNEHGLVVGMAAVPPGQMRPDPDKETTGSLRVIREMLDHASNVDEAVAILQSYNIDFEGGPPLHYLVADPSGRSVLVEFYQGEMAIMSNETPWHVATNFLRASVGESAAGQCWRYDRLSQQLTDAQGRMTTQGAMQLLSDVSQEGTQWSIVYRMSTGDVNVTMGRQYDTPHIFHLGLTGE